MQLTKTKRFISAGNLEWRSDNDAVTIEGYASTYDQPYDMGWYSETITRGAFKKTLSESPDVTLLIDHEGLPLARSTSGTLQLGEDTHGLLVRASLDTSDPDVQRLLPKMRRGDMDKMSFAFGVVKQRWSDDYSQRSVDEVSLKSGDVSVVTHPANPNASVALRARAMASSDPEKMRAAYAAAQELPGANELRALLETLSIAEDDIDISTLNELLEEKREDAVPTGKPVFDVRLAVALARRS